MDILGVLFGGLQDGAEILNSLMTTFHRQTLPGLPTKGLNPDGGKRGRLDE